MHVDALLDEHIALVQRRHKGLRSLEKQLLTLRSRCDGDTSHACAILDSFMQASTRHGEDRTKAPGGRRKQ